MKQKRRRGHGWSRRKGFSKKHSRAQKDNVVRVVIEKDDATAKKPLNVNSVETNPNPVRVRKSPEEWRLYLLNKHGGHTQQCYWFGIRRGCMKCWDDYNNSVGGGVFSRGFD